jgi:hypothetical protein
VKSWFRKSSNLHASPGKILPLPLRKSADACRVLHLQISLTG